MNKREKAKIGKIELKAMVTRSLLYATSDAILAGELNPDDGGTCNFDAPVLDYILIGITKREAMDAIYDADLNCFEWKLCGKPMLIISGDFLKGQANRRTRTARAFYSSMIQHGLPATMYYAMD